MKIHFSRLKLSSIYFSIIIAKGSHCFCARFQMHGMVTVNSIENWRRPWGRNSDGKVIRCYICRSCPLRSHRSLHRKLSQFGIRITPGRRSLQGPAATHITRRHRWLSTNNESPPPFTPTLLLVSLTLSHYTKAFVPIHTDSAWNEREAFLSPIVMGNWHLRNSGERGGTARQKQCEPSSTIKDRREKIQIPNPLPVFCAQLAAMFQNRIMRLLPNGGWISVLARC